MWVSPFVYVSEFNEKISIGRTEYRKTAWHARFVEFVSDGRCHFGPDTGQAGEQNPGTRFTRN
jgi:hypothetical protein